MTGSTMPDWLKKQLIDTGVLTESGLGRRAQLRRHKPCGIPTMRGLDSDVCAFEVSCDLGELTAIGEAMALLEDRRTYELNIRGELVYRDRYAITARPAGGRITVLADHRCTQPIPATWCKPTPRPAARPTDPEEIPF